MVFSTIQLFFQRRFHEMNRWFVRVWSREVVIGKHIQSKHTFELIRHCFAGWFCWIIQSGLKSILLDWIVIENPFSKLNFWFGLLISNSTLNETKSNRKISCYINKIRAKSNLIPNLFLQAVFWKLCCWEKVPEDFTVRRKKQKQNNLNEYF